jgi:DHA2 family multidrug resistance protein
MAGEYDASWRPRVNPWLIAATVALAAFMEVLDTSIANVALPYIAGGLGASEDQSTWVLTSYLVANAVVLPMGGWASSVLGRKRFFMSCIVVFTVASFLCGIAPSLGVLLVCRVIQGAGGGGLQPMAQAIMADSFEPRLRGLAFALYGLVAVLAPSIGPTIGGWLTDSYSWRWIFYINIPVGILAFVLTSRLVEEPPWSTSDLKNFFRVDYIGVGLLVVAMGALQITLDKGQEKDWFGSQFIQAFGITFAIAFVALIAWQWWGAKTPLMELRLFKSRNFAVCCFLMLLTGGLLNATTVLQPQFLQQQIGYTALIAGLSLSGGGIALLLVMPLAGQAVSRFPARNIIAFGFCCFAIAYYLTATKLNLGMSFETASWLRVWQIGSIPFVFIALTTAVYFGQPREKSNQISGLINFVRNIGGSVLIALTNAEVTRRGQFHQDQLQKYVVPSSSNYQHMRGMYEGMLGTSAGQANAQHLANGQIMHQLQSQSVSLAYIDVFWLLFFASLIMIPMSFLLQKNNPKSGGGEPVAAH